MTWDIRPLAMPGEGSNEIHPEGSSIMNKVLEDILEGGKGLNLTYEVRDGILRHTGEIAPETLEGR